MKNRINKNFTLIILLIIITLIFLSIFLLIYKKDKTVKTKVEEMTLTLKSKELTDVLDIGFLLLKNEYRHDKEMIDIINAYVDLQLKMSVPLNGTKVVKYAIVKQNYIYNAKYGWIPIRMPEIEVFY